MSDEPSSATSYQDVLAALHGEPLPFTPRTSKMLWFMLKREQGCDAEITTAGLTVWYGEGGSRYSMPVAPGVVSFLRAGVDLSERRHLSQRMGPAIVPEVGGFPAWGFGSRHVRLDVTDEKILIRIRTSESELSDLGPEVPIEGRPRFLILDRACPHCVQVPERYRVLSDGSLVCLACGRSSSP